MLAIWFLVALVAIIGEVLTTGLFLASVAAAALVTAALVPLTLGSVGLQFAVFAALALLGLLVVRPLVVRTLGIDSLARPQSPLAPSHVVGRHATVTRVVDQTGGQIRIGQGEFWSARPYMPGDTLPEGAVVEILAIEGLTALVATSTHSLPEEPQINLTTERGVPS